MLRVKLGREIDGHGIFEYAVSSLNITGRSREPLLAACRDIWAAIGDTDQVAGLFRGTSDTPALTCKVRAGAMLTVEEHGRGLRFVKHRAQEKPQPSIDVRRPRKAA